MNAKRNLLLGFAAALVLTVSAHAQTPAGNWSVNANGFTGVLSIAVDAAGNVTGTLFGNPVRGFWTASSRRLMIYRAVGGAAASTPPQMIQVYTGFMYPASASVPLGFQRLAGYFEAFAGTGATSARNVFGWYATK